MIGEGETSRAVEPPPQKLGAGDGSVMSRQGDGPMDGPTSSVEGTNADGFLAEVPVGWTDALTGCDGPRYWDRIVISEQARNERHRRTATIALIEFAGIDGVAQRWGTDLALRLFLRLARALASGIRSSDHIARIGRTCFAVLLVETDEIAAINFVDRVRAQCEADVDPVANGFRMAIGWASPAVGGNLDDAQRMAMERLEADVVRPA